MPRHPRHDLEQVLDSQQTDPSGFGAILKDAFLVATEFPDVEAEDVWLAVGIVPSEPPRPVLSGAAAGITEHPDKDADPAVWAMRLYNLRKDRPRSDQFLTQHEVRRVVRWSFALTQT